jgi:hypothetical protein
VVGLIRCSPSVLDESCFRKRPHSSNAWNGFSIARNLRDWCRGASQGGETAAVLDRPRLQMKSVLGIAGRKQFVADGVRALSRVFEPPLRIQARQLHFEVPTDRPDPTPMLAAIPAGAEPIWMPVNFLMVESLDNSVRSTARILR